MEELRRREQRSTKEELTPSKEELPVKNLRLRPSEAGSEACRSAGRPAIRAPTTKQALSFGSKKTATKLSTKDGYGLSDLLRTASAAASRNRRKLEIKIR